jgi:hypothetical protein
LAAAAAAVAAANTTASATRAEENRASAEEEADMGTDDGPALSTTERKLVIAKKQDTKGSNGVYRGSAGVCKSIEPKVSTLQRIKEFSNAGLRAVGLEFRFPACEQIFAGIKSSITSQPCIPQAHLKCNQVGRAEQG